MKERLLKKILSVALSVLMVGGTAAALPVMIDNSSMVVSAAETYGDFEYEVNTDNTVTITKYNGDGGNVTIPSSINGKSVTIIGYEAFYGCTSLTSVTIPDSVMSIGSDAFSNCEGLTSITIPDSVTSIGNFAFGRCTGLTSVTIPDSVTSIGIAAFSDCTGLTGITIPDSVTSIGNGAFGGCTSLTSITIPDSVMSIGSDAFSNCEGLTSITIPDSVTSIGHFAFGGCTGLTSVTIPDSVTLILEYAFYGCTSLTSITIPDSVTSIGEYAFYDCTGLKDVYYSGTKDQWNKIFFDSGNDSLINATIHYEHKIDTPVIDTGELGNLSYKIDEFGCLTISGNDDMPDYTDKTSPFYGRTDISQIIIEDGVTSIGSYVFQGMDGLMSITIPDSVTKINAHAFDGNNSMVYIRAIGVTKIEDAAFKNCKNFSFELPGGLKTIGKEAFYGCSSIGDTNIPNSVGSVGQNAFAKCGMSNATWPEGTAVITEGAFADCQNLKTVTIPYTVTKVDENAFGGCKSLITVYYDGFEDEWKEIVVEDGNDKLKSASVHWYEIRQTLEEELFEKTKLYTSDGGIVYKRVLENMEARLDDDSISQEDKIAIINNFYQAFNVTSLRDGLEYTLDQTKGKNAFDYLTSNDAFLAYQFKCSSGGCIIQQAALWQGDI